MRPYLKDFLTRIIFPFLVLAAFGYFLAAKLISIEELQTFKILNVLGISFDLAGVALLSHFFSSNARFQAFIIGPVAELIMSAFVAIPFGMIVGLHLTPENSSFASVEAVVYSIGFYLMLAGTFFLRHFIIASDDSFAKSFSPASRANLLGLFFLVGGLILQLIGAIDDLHAS